MRSAAFVCSLRFHKFKLKCSYLNSLSSAVELNEIITGI